MNSSFLRISSAERLNQNDPISNFTVSVGNDSILQKITMIAVKEVTIPNTQYNIRSNYNNVLHLSSGDFVLPAGQYSASSLINALNDLQTAVEFSENPLTYKIEVKSGSGSSIVGGNYSVIKSLGGENTYGIVLTSTNLSFSKLPDLTGSRNYYVGSASLSDGNSMISPTLPKMPIIAVVPNVANFGQITYYNSNEQKLDEIYYSSRNQGKNITSIDLKLFNLDASAVDLNGLDWSILLKVYYN